MGIAYDTLTDLKHRETLESGEDFVSVVKDGVEHVVVLEEVEGPVDMKYVSIWRERSEEEIGFENGYKLKFASGGNPSEIEGKFERFSEGDFPWTNE